MADPVGTTLRDWPLDAKADASLTAEFFSRYRAAFDADGAATFCAGEALGLTLVVAVGDHAARLQRFVEKDFGAVIQHEGPKFRAALEEIRRREDET